MTRTEAIAHLLTQPEDASVFMVCVTPDRIADRLREEHPDVYAKCSRLAVLYRAANAIDQYPRPEFNDEVGIANDIVSHLADSLVHIRSHGKD